ncbi:MAG: NADH:ubiquinone oxidoreductase [Actinomycetes bacterium]|jgi:coenzyme F420-reducing hydrogenase gamma subunit|nr:NADH:ubiquinone oxidoreductase [Actinomycetes bacterium]
MTDANALNQASCPRVVVLSLASDFGCQIQITNFPELLAMVGTIDLSYWQLATSADMPDSYDVAVIEGAVTLDEHVRLLQQVRKTAGVVIAIGACAVTGGVPGLVGTGDLDTARDLVYGEDATIVKQHRLVPAPVSSVIEVDYRVPGCPIDPAEFSALLQQALLGARERLDRTPLCAACQTIENPCFWLRGKACLGLVTRTGCGALCLSRDRACTGCRGIAADANLESARRYLREGGFDVKAFDKALEVYNTYEVNEVARS